MATTRVRRFDFAAETLAKPRRLANGWLEVDANLTRTGVLKYLNRDGSIRRELRLPEEVFKPASLATYNARPVTDDHPPARLDVKNTATFQRGSISDVGPNGRLVRGKLLITDAALIEKIERGEKHQLSPGYDLDLEETPGVYEGEPYDVIQRNIDVNHVAVVKYGRAGPEASIRMDSLDISDAVMVASEIVENNDVIEGEKMEKKTINIDGMDFEITASPAAFQAIDRRERRHTDAATQTAASIVTLTRERDTAAGRADQLDKDLKTEKAARLDAEDPAKITARVAARATIEGSAREVLGSTEKLDSLTDDQIRAKVLGKLDPEFKADAKGADNKPLHSAEYILGRFDTAIANFRKVRPATASQRVRAAIDPLTNDGGRRPIGRSAPVRAAGNDDETTARADFNADTESAWRRPPSVGTSKIERVTE